MMGQLPPAQNALFYDFCLETFVPADHLLRRIDELLDLRDLRQHLASSYSSTGRPSVDPELMIRMLLVGYCYGIRSERRLCEEIHLNLAYRWFCRLGLEAAVPDHSTFSKNRHGRFRDTDVFRHLFESVLHQCMREGLVKAEGFAIDASLIDADANRLRRVEDTAAEWTNPATTSRAVREYLAGLDEKPNQPKSKTISATDPGAAWSRGRNGQAEFRYSTNYLIDTAWGIIVDVEATPANKIAEVNSTKTMLDRVEAQYALRPQRLMGDTAYGTASLLGWMVDRGIEPHVPVWDKSARKDGTFSISDFTWDEKTGEYHCPGGKALKSHRGKSRTPRNGVTKADTVIYRATPKDCSNCALKSRCCPNTTHRKIARSIYESARQTARHVMTTPAYQVSRHERKKVEMLFAHLKRILKLDRLRLRGINGARDEFLLAATAQNLRKLVKVRGQPPDRGVSVPA
jgi:transposase